MLAEGTIFVLVALHILIPLCFIWKQHLQFPQILASGAQHALWLAPQQIRGPSVSESSVRLSELFVLLFPAVKTGATVCVTAFILGSVQIPCALLLQGTACGGAVVSLGIAVGFGQSL